MSANTSIEWATHTFNPWWGCARVSPGCEHCYAETWAKRFGVKWGVREVRRTFGAKYWAHPVKWNAAAGKAGRRDRVFCASMADVFDEHGPEEERERLWSLIQETPHLDWLLLTKRPENWSTMLPWGEYGTGPTAWRNVWLGVTVEDQKRADERMPLLVAQSAARRFVSYEPALGPVNLEPWSGEIDWVIAGSESGSGARPMQEDWVRSMRDWCAKTGTYFFLKQTIRDGKKVSLPLLDGSRHAEVPR